MYGQIILFLNTLIVGGMVAFLLMRWICPGGGWCGVSLFWVVPFAIFVSGGVFTAFRAYLRGRVNGFFSKNNEGNALAIAGLVLLGILFILWQLGIFENL